MSKISDNFSRGEFACKCGCGFDTVDAVLLRWLEQIRANFGKPVTVTSGCRCATYNKRVGGSPNSQHVTGRAADIKVAGESPEDVATYAEMIGCQGVGRYSTWVHIDSRSGAPARWKH